MICLRFIGVYIYISIYTSICLEKVRLLNDHVYYIYICTLEQFDCNSSFQLTVTQSRRNQFQVAERNLFTVTTCIYKLYIHIYRIHVYTHIVAFPLDIYIYIHVRVHMFFVSGQVYMYSHIYSHIWIYIYAHISKQI